jgi:hypothetical protein
MEQEVRNAACNAANAVCDVLRYLGDVSYAILPREVAHDFGDLNKSFWTCVRNAVEKEIEWIDERVAGGDKMREEWEARCHHNESAGATEPAN